MSNNEHKLNLGHKPDMDEVVIFGKSIHEAGKHKLETETKAYLNTDDNEEKNKIMVKIGMSYALAKVGEMLNKFVEEGVLEDPEWEMDEIIDKIKKEKTNEHKDKHSEEECEKYELFDMDMDDVDYSYGVIDSAVQKVCEKLKNKFGGKNSLALIAGYCEGYLDVYKAKVKEQKKAEDIINAKEMEKVDIKDAIKEMREEELKDIADALEKITDNDDDIEVNVFKVEKKD